MRLDEFGIDYIEGGWPGSNPRDKDFFARAKDLQLKHARLTAFGSTRFAKNRVDRDPNVRALIESGTPVISIFGKTWDLHTRRALGITEEENLKLIGETVRFLKEHGKEVIFDAEHFFDGYTSNSRFRPARARSRADRRRRHPLPLRHQRRHADGPSGRNRSRRSQALRRHRSGSTSTTTRIAPWPTPSPPSSRAPPTSRAA